MSAFSSRCALALGALVCGLLSSANAAPQLTLADGGRSEYSIVVAPDAVQAPKAAALELQSYLEKITGAKLPIVEAPPAKGHAIYLGENAWSKARGVNFDKLAPEEFVIRSVGRDLILAGRDGAGDPWYMGWDKTWTTPTLFAVDAFLERCGVRWYWPGELGEEIPRRAQLKVKTLNIRERPGFNAREISADTTNPDIARWMVRNRLGEYPKTNVWHNWWKILPESKYYKEHPEYFALVNGKRGVGDGATGYVWGHQVCTSNPDVRRIFIQEITEFFDKHKNIQSFSISANDGNGQCECDACRALDVEKNPDGSPVLTDRMMDFYNAVARGVAQKYPQKFLGAYAYNEYAKPTQRVRVEPNLMLRDVYNYAGNMLWDESYRRTVYDRTQQWRAIAPNMTLVSYYYYDPNTLMNLPLASTAVLPPLIKHLKTSGGRGMFLAVQHAAIQDEYLVAKLLWNPNADADVVLKDYYQGLFGQQAGALVQQYHALLQNRQRALASEVMQRAGFAKYETDDLNQKLTYSLELYRPIRAQVKALLEQAATQPMTATQQARLEVVRKNWHYTELTLDAVDAIDALEKELKDHATQPDTQRIIAVRTALEARNKFMNEVIPSDPLGLTIGGAVRQSEKNNKSQIPFDIAAARIQSLLTSQKRVAHARSIAASTPTADDWQKAPQMESFVEAYSNAKPLLATNARVLYNRNALFLSLDCDDPDIKNVWDSGTATRDGEVWNDNSLDVFLDPDNARRQYFHLISNQRGTQFDSKEKGATAVDASWNGDWKVTTQQTDNGWRAVFEVPFAALGIEAPLKGDVWGLNLCRARPASKKEYSAWSPTFGGFQNPLMFGQLIFD